ncbi:MAG: hypothetical protein ACFFD4_03645 [Candidatus Odinarchaeota archaeon]
MELITVLTFILITIPLLVVQLLNVKPLVAGVAMIIDKAFQNPFDGIIWPLGILSFLIGTILCTWGGLEGVNALEWVRGIKGSDIHRLMEARLFQRSENFSFLALGMSFLMQSFVFFLISKFF